MKHFFAPFVIGLMTLSCGSSAKPVPEPEKDPDPLPPVSISAPEGTPLATKESLTAAEAQTYMSLLQQSWKSTIKSSYEASFNAGKIIIDGKKMPIWWTTYGSIPAGGRSLVISLHGGGGADARSAQSRNSANASLERSPSR